MMKSYEFSKMAQESLCALGDYFSLGGDIDGWIFVCAFFHVLTCMAVQKYFMRVGIVGIVVLVSWMVYVSSKQIARNQRIEHEVALLAGEAEKIQRENETLSEKINYFSSANFREQEAKEKLGMKKSNEAVVAIQSRREVKKSTSEGFGEEKQTSESSPRTTHPNYRKWWDLFFGTS